MIKTKCLEGDAESDRLSLASVEGQSPGGLVQRLRGLKGGPGVGYLEDSLVKVESG